ncbi:MAG: type II toxin-antitoxin system death-on-curing family toxin [Deltaproteobacteria bacterium]|nr:type II toxin-antitoxin system death-on-curing family toxin [Deltaproteobacteria bacterium]
MRFLATEECLFIHYRIIEETGVSHGLRDTALFESAVHRPLAVFGGKGLYPDVFSKAAALMHSLVRNHPFVDGNKRTATAAACLFIELNGKRLTATNKELERFAVKAAIGNIGVEEMAAWFREKTERA